MEFSKDRIHQYHSNPTKKILSIVETHRDLP